MLVASVERWRSLLTNCLPPRGLGLASDNEMRDRWCSAAVWLERGQQLAISNQECPPRSTHLSWIWRITMVMIGIDPHKGSHTAVAIDDREQVLTERLVRATPVAA